MIKTSSGEVLGHIFCSGDVRKGGSMILGDALMIAFTLGFREQGKFNSLNIEFPLSDIMTHIITFIILFIIWASVRAKLGRPEESFFSDGESPFYYLSVARFIWDNFFFLTALNWLIYIIC